MASIRFLADQHIPRPVTEGLRRRGIDILSIPIGSGRMLACSPLLIQQGNRQHN